LPKETKSELACLMSTPSL